MSVFLAFSLFLAIQSHIPYDLSMKLLLTGADGMLGQAICRQLSPHHQLFPLNKQTLDVTDADSACYWVNRIQPDWVLHCAALTDVDRCEREPDLAFAINAKGTENMMIACRHFQIPMLYLSSIAVFSGDKSTPYNEQDTPHPANQHGVSKWQGEQAVAQLPHHLIVRTGWLFGGKNDKKFIRKILDLAQKRPTLSVVDDKIGSPTYVDDLAQGIGQLLVQNEIGVVHLVNDGMPVSRFELAKKALGLAKLNNPISPVPSTHFPQLAPRPNMEATVSLCTAGWLPDWQDSLATYIAQVEISV